MADRYGGCGIFGGNCEILFFILVFLLLFCNPGFGYGGFGCGYKE